jgi:hypothetical protein
MEHPPTRAGNRLAAFIAHTGYFTPFPIVKTLDLSELGPRESCGPFFRSLLSHINSFKYRKASDEPDQFEAASCHA